MFKVPNTIILRGIFQGVRYIEVLIN